MKPTLILLLFMVVVAAPTTLLGWIAVSQIRRSGGRLHGLWLAVFDGLLFPLLTLNVFVGWLVWLVLMAVILLIGPAGRGFPGTNEVILLSLPIIVPLNWFIIRRVWHAVNAGLGLPSSDTAASHGLSEAAPSQHQQRTGSPMFWLILPLGLHGFGLLVLTVLCVKVVPTFAEIYAGFGTPLPAMTRFVISLSQFVQRGGYLLLPVLLAFDAVICWLLLKFSFRKLFGTWTVVAFLGQVLVGIISGVVLYLPTLQWKQTVTFTPPVNASPTRQHLSFGPVLERVVNLEPPGTNSALDLDSGQFVSLAPIARFFTDTNYASNADEAALNDFERFVNKTGVDAVGYTTLNWLSFDKDHPDGQPGSAVLNGLSGGMNRTFAGEVENEDWDRANAQWVVEQCKRLIGRHRDTLIYGTGVLPRTYVFKTRAGGQGILQITGHTANLRGVKIRYKLANLTSVESQAFSSAQAGYREAAGKERTERLAVAEHVAQQATGRRPSIEQFLQGRQVHTGYNFELFEKVPNITGEYRIRSDARQYPLDSWQPSFTTSRGTAYHLPTQNRFYVQWDPPGASTRHYYGPFEGNPAEVLSLTNRAVRPDN